MLRFVGTQARYALVNGLHSSHNKAFARTLLSASFACSEAWNSRLSAPDFGNNVSGLDLGNGLLRALERREPVAPVDVDVYANKLDTFDTSYLAYFANVMSKFRSTQESLGKLASTDHAVIRCMLSMGQTELLIDWLRDKFAYGIFLDQYSASLLIDHLLESGNTKMAALVAFDHALQDLPSDGWVCSGLMLLACVSRAAEQLPEWTSASAGDPLSASNDADEDADDDDDENTRHVIVDYIRRPNYDGHFDLDEERLQIGCSLACVGRRLSAEWPAQPAGLACQLIGLAAGEKPDSVLKLLRRQKLPALSQSVIDTIDALLGLARCHGDPAGVNEPGKRPLCRLETVEEARAAVRSLAKSPKAAAGDEPTWDAELSAFARRLVSEHEAKTAAKLSALYAEFASVRLAELRSHGDWLRKRRLFQDVKSRLDSLVGEQESLTAFDRESEIRYAAWLAPRTRAEARITSAKIWAQDIANTDRLLEQASEAAARGGGKQQVAAAARLRRSTVTKEKFRPLKE